MAENSMVICNKCRFCGGEFAKVKRKRDAFCNTVCRRLYRINGGDIHSIKDKTLLQNTIDCMAGGHDDRAATIAQRIINESTMPKRKGRQLSFLDYMNEQHSKAKNSPVLIGELILPTKK